MKQQLALVVSPSNSGETEKETAQPKASKLRRFLRWTTIMKTSTFDKDGNAEEKDQWNYGLLFFLGILYVTVIGGFLVLIVGGTLLYLDIREDYRTQQKWKEVESYDQLQREKKSCIENAERLKGLIRYNESKNQETPPQFLEVKECGKVNTTEEH